MRSLERLQNPIIDDCHLLFQLILHFVENLLRLFCYVYASRLDCNYAIAPFFQKESCILQKNLCLVFLRNVLVKDINSSYPVKIAFRPVCVRQYRRYILPFFRNKNQIPDNPRGKINCKNKTRTADNVRDKRNSVAVCSPKIKHPGAGLNSGFLYPLNRAGSKLAPCGIEIPVFLPVFPYSFLFKKFNARSYAFGVKHPVGFKDSVKSLLHHFRDSICFLSLSPTNSPLKKSTFAAMLILLE